MQAQSTRNQQNQLTATQSLASVQTLLRAGLGCISYLRNLLPADNFSESYLTSSNNDASFSSTRSDSDAGTSFASDNSGLRRSVSGFKIMTVTRGFTEEADKLLDYMEYGIFDALQKQYLKSFIFAIYLDQQDPNNIVEAYTFNFQYHTIPGTDTTIPIMSLGEDLMKLSLNGNKNADPVAEATKKGRTPTLGEVKRSLKTLIKNLIQATTQMDALPKRRYATFKLFYHDSTPADYEPPHFRAGDVDKDKWFFFTHDKNEIPEKCSVGRLQTGWHGVDVHVASVSGFLPSAEDNNAAFLGTTWGGGGFPVLTPAEEAATRAQQIEAQQKDAENRRIVWDAEDGLTDMDAEGEDDPECEKSALSIVSNGAVSSREEVPEPLGIRLEDGSVAPFAEKGQGAEKEDVSGQGMCGERRREGFFAGVSENVPIHVRQLRSKQAAQQAEDIAQTQGLEFTQEIGSPMHVSDAQGSPPSFSLPPSDIEDTPPTSSTAAEEIDSQMLMKDLMQSSPEDVSETFDSEMLDMETQVVPSYPMDIEDSIRSFSPGEATPKTTEVAQTKTVIDRGLECECGVDDDEDQCWCEYCGRWYHVWCMGYHSAKDNRLPNKFICFDCRVRADQNWDLIVVHDLYPSMISKFKDLALFRRAIKVAETEQPETLSAFTKVIGCESIVAGQLFKRLESEGFIAVESINTDELGFLETRSHSSKARNKGKGAKRRQARPRKPLQRNKYVFVHASKRSTAYLDYFNSSTEVEKRILGLSELRPKHKLRQSRVENEARTRSGGSPLPIDGSSANAENHLPADRNDTQTQLETQLTTPHVPEEDYMDILKRKAPDVEDQARASKKVKISVVSGVDLGD